MKDNYTYPAILDYNEENYINIEFVDFPGAITCVETGEDFLTEAQDLLTLYIKDYEDKQIELPVASEEIELENNQKLIYINIWMPYHRTKVKETYVKKTLTIPTWLDILAKSNNVNFSAVLVEGLKRELNLK